jgi:DNA replication and repair protein RecF
LYLEDLKLTNYRNYDLVNESFSPHFNLLTGANAQGKTNLLEAIYYLSTGGAYRPARDLQLIRWDHSFFRIEGFFRNHYGEAKIEINYKNNGNTAGNTAKEVKINGIKISKMADLLGVFTSVLFAPEDLFIVKGSPAERRRLLDNDIAQVSPSYYKLLQKYMRILQQRNFLLRKIFKKQASLDELAVWNQQFIGAGAEIIQKRLQVLEKMAPLTRLMQRKLTNGAENLEIKYLFNRTAEIRNPVEITAMLKHECEILEREEIVRGLTLFGPHRDDYAFLLNGVNLKYYGSQGQHRTAVLAVKLAELEFFKAETGEYPVLLLDDVLSELDQNRKEYLVKTIISKEIQCFITTTEELPLGAADIPVQRYVIKEGRLCRM